MYLHVTFSWLLANLIHPYIFFLFQRFVHGDQGPFSIPQIVPILLGLLMFSLVFSLPCLLLGWALFGCIIRARFTIEARWLLWFSTALILVLLEFLIIMMVVNNIRVHFYPLMISPILAVVTAIILRRNQFIILACSIDNNSLKKIK